MTRCATEPELVALATGDGDADSHTHAAGCSACAARLAALERDLSLLTATLREAPVPVAAPRRAWLPVGVGAAALSTALLLLTLAPWRAAPPAEVAGTDVTAELAETLSAALFADDGGDITSASSDATVLAAALSGGTLCDGAYAGDDCADSLLAPYD